MMRALVLKAYRRFAIESVPMPRPGPDEVLVRVRACGICGSDVHGMDGSTGRRIPPLIMGHEAAGEIAEVGTAVSGWKAGEQVTLDSTIYCGRCWHCLRGEVNLCDQRRVLGVSCAEFRRDGAFADYVAVPERILYRLPRGLEFEKAALAEPVAVAMHAVGRLPHGENASAAVVGAGMIGLLVIQALKVEGWRRILAIDLDEGRLEKARRCGATAAATPGSAEVHRLTRDLGEGRGLDAAVDAVGTAKSLETAIACVRKGGVVTLVGNLEAAVPFPLQSVVTRQLTLLGSCASAGEYPRSLELMAEGRIDVTELISGTATLEDAPAWFERLYRKEAGLMKVLVKP